MNKGQNTHMGRHGYIIDTVNQNPSAWTERQFNDIHPGIEDFNIEARHLAESMVGHIDDKKKRMSDKEGAECCQFYECAPLGIE